MGALETKSLVEVKQADSCRLEAVIATLGAVDADGDLIEPGAFGEQVVPFLWSHRQDMLPLGKARVREVGDQVVAQVEILDQATCEWLKLDFSTDPKQEYSWGFTVPEGGARREDGVRVISAVELHEVSGVLRAASIGTRTVGVKSGCSCGCGGGCKSEAPLALGPLVENLRGAVDSAWEVENSRGLTEGEADEILHLGDAVGDLLDAVLEAVDSEQQKYREEEAAEAYEALGYKRYRVVPSIELTDLAQHISGDDVGGFTAWEAHPGEKGKTMHLPHAVGWCIPGGRRPLIGVNADVVTSKAGLAFLLGHEIQHAKGSSDEHRCNVAGRDLCTLLVDEEHGEAFYAAMESAA